MKIAIIGVPGSGKSTIAALLAEEMNLSYIPELFENNPYITQPGVPQELVTLFQQQNIHRQYLSKARGVFDTTADSSKHIFLNEAERGYLLYLMGNMSYSHQYTNTIALYASFNVIKNRIKERNRIGLVNRELEMLDVWYTNYMNYLDSMTYDLTIINANQSIEKIVSDCVTEIT